MEGLLSAGPKHGSAGSRHNRCRISHLDRTKFQVFIPQHSLTLAQNYCLIYMLMPTNQDFWMQPAVQRLPGVNDLTAQKSLLLLLWYAQTPDSDKVIGEFSAGA